MNDLVRRIQNRLTAIQQGKYSPLAHDWAKSSDSVDCLVSDCPGALTARELSQLPGHRPLRGKLGPLIYTKSCGR